MEFVALYWRFALLAVALVVAAVWDVRTHRIPNWITIPIIVIGLAAAGVASARGAEPGITEALSGLAMGFLPMLVLRLTGGLGMGDVKLMAGVGALTADWRLTLMAMFWTFVAGAVLAVFVMIRHRVVRRTLLRVGRFLFLLLAPGRKVDPASPDSPKVIFGVAICLGTLAAIAESLLFPGRLASMLGW